MIRIKSNKDDDKPENDLHIVNTTIIYPEDGSYLYDVMINREKICSFLHNKDDGLAICLQRAANAVKIKTSPDENRIISKFEEKKNEFIEKAKHNAILYSILKLHEQSNCTFEYALLEGVLKLAEQNEELVKHTIKLIESSVR